MSLVLHFKTANETLVTVAHCSSCCLYCLRLKVAGKLLAGLHLLPHIYQLLLFQFLQLYLYNCDESLRFWLPSIYSYGCFKCSFIGVDALQCMRVLLHLCAGGESVQIQVSWQCRTCVTVFGVVNVYMSRILLVLSTSSAPMPAETLPLT